jgi:hypothetical protein
MGKAPEIIFGGSLRHWAGANRDVNFQISKLQFPMILIGPDLASVGRKRCELGKLEEFYGYDSLDYPDIASGGRVAHVAL